MKLFNTFVVLAAAQEGDGPGADASKTLMGSYQEQINALNGNGGANNGGTGYVADPYEGFNGGAFGPEGGDVYETGNGSLDNYQPANDQYNNYQAPAKNNYPSNNQYNAAGSNQYSNNNYQAPTSNYNIRTLKFNRSLPTNKHLAVIEPALAVNQKRQKKKEGPSPVHTHTHAGKVSFAVGNPPT